MGMSDAHPRGLEIFLKTMQTVSWLGGLWGLFMLVGMVGNTLDSTQWKIRQKMVATLALVILIINWLDKVSFQEVLTPHGMKYFQLLLHLDVVPCVSPLLPKLNVVVLAESSVILLLCLLLAGYQFVLSNRHRYAALLHGMTYMYLLHTLPLSITASRSTRTTS